MPIPTWSVTYEISAPLSSISSSSPAVKWSPAVGAAIAPGFFPKTSDAAELENRGSVQPSGRVGFLPELGPLAVFLASAASDYLSGETIVIDGGAGAGGLLPSGMLPRAEG